MGNNNNFSISNRREFLGKALSIGCLSCINPSFLCETFSKSKVDKSEHKFKDDSKWSFEYAYKFAYANALMPNLKAIAEEIGKDQTIEILKKSAEERAIKDGENMAKETNNPSLDNYNGWARNPDSFWQHVVTYSIVEDTPKAFEFKITECLWAKTLREAKGEDFGYAIICNPDFDHASGYSPQLKLTRTKTLMQGDDCCNHRYTWNE